MSNVKFWNSAGYYGSKNKRMEVYFWILKYILCVCVYGNRPVYGVCGVGKTHEEALHWEYCSIVFR